MRVIDADELKSYMDECSKESKFRVYYAYAESFINYAPTIDAVPVVRCRECFGRNCWEKDENGCDICLVSGLYVRGEDDYCPYGEQKGGVDNG